jgi:hypothetical protein
MAVSYHPNMPGFGLTGSQGQIENWKERRIPVLTWWHIALNGNKIRIYLILSEIYRDQVVLPNW